MTGKVIHAEHRFGQDKGLMLNGVSLDDAIAELSHAYQAPHSEHGEVAEHPLIVRQRRISANTSRLEDKVKSILGEGVTKASKEHADKIITTLAFEIAQSDGYKGKLGEFTSEQARNYLTAAANALGNPTIGNVTEFTKGIINLAAARPGDPLYDANSALAQLVQYAATQRDAESKRINYLQALVGEKWQMPEYGTAMQGAINKTFGIPLAGTATAGEALREINERSQIASRAYAAQTGKTYLKPADHGEHRKVA